MTIGRLLFVSGMRTVLSSMSLFAQTFGEVTGHISDDTGAGVPAAKMYLTNTATNAVRETLSTDSGDYTFAAAGVHDGGVGNLIAAKKAKPMIVVMDNLNTVTTGEDASIFATRGTIASMTVPDPAATGGGRGAPGAARGGFPSNWGTVFTDMMFTDLVPMVERTYRVLPGRENRASPRGSLSRTGGRFVSPVHGRERE